MRLVTMTWAIAWCASLAWAQSASVRVEVRSASGPVGGADITLNGAAHRADAQGVLAVAVPPGTVEIVVTKEAFAPVVVSVEIQPGQQQVVMVDLPPLTHEEALTVSATRTDTRVEDLPMRVEVLAREEIEEKMLMTPGDIVMMLNEMGGMRVQATSPSLGAASVRIQGMRGRYTRFLSDGLPLFGEVGGLGLLQIPPMDLGQVEVIKGVASSLYGAGAMGGVVNLISRRPGPAPEREILINRSSRGATDAVCWLSSPLPGGWSVSTLAGGHWQTATDVDDDVWADLPGYSRGVVRPRVFWENGNGGRFFATTGVMVEDRTGGTLDGAPLPVAGTPYVEALETRRFDVGALAQAIWRQSLVITARGAASAQHHDHQFGEFREHDRHDTAFGEIAVRGTIGRHTWVVGAAVERDAYRPEDVPRFAYTFIVPGVFGQGDIELARWLSLSASGRVDHHSEYGTFLSPRIAALVRSGRWNSRVSAGTGFFGPSALTEGDGGGRPHAAVDSAVPPRGGGPERLARHRPDGRPRVVFGDVVCLARPSSDRRRSIGGTRADQRARTGDQRGCRTAGDPPPWAVCRDGHVHARPIARIRERRTRGRTAHSAAQRRHRRDVGARRGRTRGRGVVLHGRAAARGESVRGPQRAVPHCRRARRTAFRAGTAVRERREPHQRPAKSMAAARASVTRTRWSMDRRRVGATRGAQHQRRRPCWFMRRPWSRIATAVFSSVRRDRPAPHGSTRRAPCGTSRIPLPGCDARCSPAAP